MWQSILGRHSHAPYHCVPTKHFQKLATMAKALAGQGRRKEIHCGEALHCTGGIWGHVLCPSDRGGGATTVHVNEQIMMMHDACIPIIVRLLTSTAYLQYLPAIKVSQEAKTSPASPTPTALLVPHAQTVNTVTCGKN